MILRIDKLAIELPMPAQSVAQFGVRRFRSCSAASSARCRR